MAKIIKGDGSAVAPAPAGAAPARKLIDAEVYDASRQAKQIVVEAQAEAERIRADAEAERERVFAEARDAGREDGLAQVTELLAQAAGVRDKRMAELEHQVVELAVKVAEKILGREILLDDEAVVDIAAQALQTARQQREISLRVNPKDAAALRENQKRLVDLLSRAKHIEIKDDETVPRGGVLVETEVGVIDARLDVQLEMIRRVLEEAGEQ